MNTPWPTDDPDELALLQAAHAMLDKAYAPYSGFAVGAALRMADGAVHCGANVENIAYPLGSCAEQSALSVMVAASRDRVVSVAIMSRGPSPVAPCGGCRQRLAEFGSPEMRVLMATAAGGLKVARLGELLPGAFGADQMGS